MEATGIDAENLAKYLSMDLLQSGKAIIEIIEDLKAIFRMALRIEKDRTALKNRIKKTLDRAGIRPKGFNLNYIWVRELLHYFIDQNSSLGLCLKAIKEDKTILEAHRRNILKNISKFAPYYGFSLSPAQRAIIRQDLVELGFKTARKSLLAVEIDHMILERPGLRKQAHNLATIPGISPFSAVWILAEIGNINQFQTIRQFLSYCGCSPRIVSSASKVYSAHISRHSNSYLRTIFYNAAVVVCNLTKSPSALKSYATKTLKRKRPFSPRLAYCIVASKIARIAYAILRDGVVFNPNFEDGFKNSKNGNDTPRFSITDKKIIRRARNALRRVGTIQDLGILTEHTSILAKQLDLALQGKNFSD